MQLLQSTEERLRANEQAIRSLDEQRAILQSQLAQMEPRNPVIGKGGERMLMSRRSA